MSEIVVLPSPPRTLVAADPAARCTVAGFGDPDGPRLRLPSRPRWPALQRPERGLVSAEWAMVIIAAVAIVGVLVSILTSGPIQEVLLELVKKIIGGALTGV